MNRIYTQQIDRTLEILPTYKELAKQSQIILNFCNNKNSEFHKLSSHKQIIYRPFLVKDEKTFNIRNIEDVVEIFLEDKPEYEEAIAIANKYKKGTPLTQKEIDVLSKNANTCVFDVAKRVDEYIEPIIIESEMCKNFINTSYNGNKKFLDILEAEKRSQQATNPTFDDNMLNSSCNTMQNIIDLLEEPINNYHATFNSSYDGLNFTEYAVVQYINKYTCIDDARFSKPIDKTPNDGSIEPRKK